MNVIYRGKKICRLIFETDYTVTTTKFESKFLGKTAENCIEDPTDKMLW
jgi:hypothetical protein